MSLLEKIKGLFSRASLPEETRLLLTNVKDVEDLDLPTDCIRTALDELLAEDGELQIQLSGGREIVKRRRL